MLLIFFNEITGAFSKKILRRYEDANKKETVMKQILMRAFPRWIFVLCTVFSFFSIDNVFGEWFLLIMKFTGKGMIPTLVTN